MELDELCSQADVIFLTTLADDSTKGLIDKKKIDLMKKTAIILSPIDEIAYDRDYILEKVAKGELGGLGFESSEKTIESYEGNVFCVPEIGYYTKQTLDNEPRTMSDSMISILEGKPKNVVNLSRVKPFHDTKTSKTDSGPNVFAYPEKSWHSAARDQSAA